METLQKLHQALEYAAMLPQPRRESSARYYDAAAVEAMFAEFRTPEADFPGHPGHPVTCRRSCCR